MALSKPFKVAAVQAAPHYLDVQTSYFDHVARGAL